MAALPKYREENEESKETKELSFVFTPVIFVGVCVCRWSGSIRNTKNFISFVNFQIFLFCDCSCPRMTIKKLYYVYRLVQVLEKNAENLVIAVNNFT